MGTKASPTEMTPSDDPVTVDPSTISLERSRMDSGHDIELLVEEETTPPQKPAPRAFEYTQRRIHNKVSEKTHKAKCKIREALHLEGQDQSRVHESPILADPVNNNQRDASLLSRVPHPDKETLKEFVHNPADTVKWHGNKQLADNLATKEVPHIHEKQLLEAKETFDRAKTEKDRLLALKDVELLLRERRTWFIRWTTDRHIRKVRVRPQEQSLTELRRRRGASGPSGNSVADWNDYSKSMILAVATQYGGQYIGYGSDPPPPSKQTIVPCWERFLLATAPLQEFLLTVRQIYQWQDPRRTTGYLCTYLVLWYFDLLLGGMLSAIIYLVIRRRSRPKTLQDLRDEIERTEDVSRSACSLSDFIEKNGQNEWGDRIMQEMGPWLMVQLADLANLFEAARNFYEWRKPRRTLFTICVLAVLVLVTVILPTRILVKISSLLGGISFFGLFPLATKYPEYRLLVSIPKRLLWNIPTHAEWAIQAIQAEGHRYLSEHHEPTNASSTSPLKSHENVKHIIYSARHGSSRGHLIVAPTTIRFESSLLRKVHFEVSFHRLERLEKTDRIIDMILDIPSPKALTDTGKDLKIVDKDCNDWILENVKSRDQAFAMIVGLNRAKWQVLW